jgi:hypothetical protein
MDYSYRRSAQENEKVFTLRSYDVVIFSEGKEVVIPYAEIIEVRLLRKRMIYEIVLNTLDFGGISISNLSYDSKGQKVLQSRAYHTFVRMLHMHLSEKSKAYFYTGFNAYRKMIGMSGLALITLSLFLTLEYVNVLPGKSLLVALIVFFMGSLIIFGFQINQWPRAYNPSSIPLKMLPPAV